MNAGDSEIQDYLKHSVFDIYLGYIYKDHVSEKAKEIKCILVSRELRLSL